MFDGSLHFLNKKKQDKWQICIDKVTIVRNSCFELIEYDMYHGRWMYPVYSHTKGVHWQKGLRTPDKEDNDL